MWLWIIFQLWTQVALAETKRMVVLEFHSTGMSSTVMTQLSDQSRMAILDSLHRKGYDLMTRENMMMILSDMGKDASCLEGSCEVDVARNVGADFVVSGNVAFIEEQFDITLKLHNSQTGSFEGMKSDTVNTVRDLKVQTYNLTLDLLHDGLGESVAKKKELPSEKKELQKIERVREDAKTAHAELQGHMKGEDTSKNKVDKKTTVETSSSAGNQSQTRNTQVQTTSPSTSKKSSSSSSGTKKVAVKSSTSQVPSKPSVPDQPAPTTKSSVSLERGAGVPSTLSNANYKALLLPAGTYKRGCTREQQKKCNFNEKPVQSVTISKPFYMMDTEVTQDLYMTLSKRNPSAYEGNAQPVDSVSWFDAVKFANKLSEQEGLTPCYQINGEDVKWSNKSCNGWRLPTEAEWEYAARAFSDTSYSGSTSASSVALYYDNSNDITESVRSRQSNRFGLYGMSGNVGEWCWDGLHAYSETPVTDPSKRGNKYRVYRGGGLDSSKSKLRTSSREKEFPTTRSENIGFRLVRFP